MSPLVALTLTAFGGIVVLALLIWTLIMPRHRPPEPPERPAVGPRPRPTPNVSNDEVRGARVRPPDRARSTDRVQSPDRVRSEDRPKSDDPFEEFLRAERDDR
ncbi:MAG: hypothetical protein R6T93_01420 [Trueperaceae bacterium]